MVCFSKPKAEVAEAILPTSLSDIKLPGERHFETNAVDGSNPGQSNKNETNVQSSSEMTNVGKAASDKEEGNERPNKRDSSVESSSDKRSRSNSLRRRRRSTSRRRSISRRKRSPSPRSRRRRRSPSYRPRSRSQRRSPRRYFDLNLCYILYDKQIFLFIMLPIVYVILNNNEVDYLKEI